MRRLILNRFTLSATDHLLLSVYWLVGCLPLVTAPVSTAALFEVARLRQRGEDPPLTRTFVEAFRRYAGRALAIGLGWAALGGFLALDLMIAVPMRGAAGDVLLVALIAAAIVYTLISLALFPVLVSFDTGAREQLRTAALVAVLSPARGLLALLVVAVAAATVWTVPLAILAAPSLVASLLQRLYYPAFHRLPAPTPARRAVRHVLT